jgi:DNA repair protein RadD
MSGPVLRPYQAKCVDALRASYSSGHRPPLLVLPTGAGKTVVFSEATRGARAKGKRVLIIVHRRELLRQASAKLTAAGVPHRVVGGGFDDLPAE